MPTLTPRAVAPALAAVGLLALLAALSCWPFSAGDRFLGPADFAGQPLPPSPLPPPEGEATWNGFLTFTNLDRTLVEGLLPGGYLLATNTALPARHPVALIFGDQTDGTTLLSPLSPGQPVPVTNTDRVHYSEMILGVPFVQKAQQQGWHTYIVRMYLDFEVAVLGGQRYGYEKEFACLDWTGWGVRIWQQPLVCQPPVLLQPRQLLSGDFRITGGWRGGPAALASTANFQDMIDIWRSRILGTTTLWLGFPVPVIPVSVPVCSYFDWDLADAQVAKAATTYRFESAFRSDMTSWPALGDLDNVAGGAVVVRGMRWGLGAPFGC